MRGMSKEDSVTICQCPAERQSILSRGAEIFIRYPVTPQGLRAYCGRLGKEQFAAARWPHPPQRGGPRECEMTRQVQHRKKAAKKGGTFDFYSIAKDTLLVGLLKGVLDAKTAGKIVEFIETKEIITDMGFNRFCDMTQLDGIDISSDEVFQLASRRRTFNPNDIRVKSAFLATNLLAFGIARMYEQMLNSPRIEVRVWNDRQAAADWLGVNLDRLIL
jgi:hypothetical protein